MNQRKITPLASFRAWAKVEPRFADTASAQAHAMADREVMAATDLESTAVTLRTPDGSEIDCFTGRESPFVLRVLATPMEEFQAWRQEGTELLLEPRWYVRIIADPAGRAPGFGQKGVRAYLYTRTYAAGEARA